MTRYSGAWNYAPTRVRFALPAALGSISRISKFPPARKSNSSNADGVSDRGGVCAVNPVNDPRAHVYSKRLAAADW